MTRLEERASVKVFADRAQHGGQALVGPSLGHAWMDRRGTRGEGLERERRRRLHRTEQGADLGHGEDRPAHRERVVVEECQALAGDEREIVEDPSGQIRVAVRSAWPIDPASGHRARSPRGGAPAARRPRRPHAGEPPRQAVATQTIIARTTSVGANGPCPTRCRSIRRSNTASPQACRRRVRDSATRCRRAGRRRRRLVRARDRRPRGRAPSTLGAPGSRMPSRSRRATATTS